MKYSDTDSFHSQGAIVVNLRKQNFKEKVAGKVKCTRTYRATEIDAVAVYVPRVEKIIWIPAELFDNKMGITFRLTPPQNKQTVGVHFLNDYVW